MLMGIQRDTRAEHTKLFVSGIAFTVTLALMIAPCVAIYQKAFVQFTTVSVEAEEIFFAHLVEMVARPFRHEAERRHLAFDVAVDPGLGRSMITDSKRLQQVLKNLLSNAFKFTHHGSVSLTIEPAQPTGTLVTCRLARKNDEQEHNKEASTGPDRR